ncbi:MAG: glutamate formimidoyltransferase [Anaerolineaceae bacterium]|nr:glutamate formimidoyltransferase [Anaerolineaceae bacterium]
MTNKLVECVPNFSEGRRLEVVDSIVSAIQAVPGVHILDRSSDADHNRSVITFVGPPEVMVDAAFAGIAKAAELIDLDSHSGAHPRLGATDVVPFIPLAGVSMPECVELARQLGQRVGEVLGIPVYLYEAAATRPDRENLAAVRKGEYEGLKEAIGADPDRAPDFGPAQVGKAGATVIGARAPLVAYNVYLTTDDVQIAKEIAKAMRHSSGGFRFVKGLGLLVDGRAQVSMNLTDFNLTPIARVQEAIRREAARYGVTIHHAELVGLIPQKALVDAAQWYLQLDQFEPDQILETRLFAAQSGGESQPSFLDQLAAGTATPGGGSAAAYSGAMAAALASMVARLTIGKKKYADVEVRMHAIAAEADSLRLGLEAGAERDSAAFDAVMAAFKLPKETDTEKVARAEAIEKATHHAALVPLEACRQAVRVLELMAELAETANVNAISDAASGAALARAALTAAGMNVKVNANSIADKDTASQWLVELITLEERAARAETRVQQMIRERAGIGG